ncbi:MAG: GNAT family N-acetyltransferase [Paracoccaceae bacterium]
MTYAALPTLRTPRLTLRPLQETDADAIVEGVGNYDVSKWLGVVPYPYARQDALDYIGKVQQAGEPVWGVHDASGLVGTVSTTHELGYWLARRAWRKGYGFEAAQAALGHWFADPEHGDLASGHFFGNERSRAVLLALGFKEVAQRTRFAKSLNQDVTSHEMLITRADWEGRQKIDIRTKRLRMRPMVEEDAPFLMDLARPEVTRMLFRLITNLSLEEAQAFARARAWRGVPGYACTIERDGQPIGYIATGSLEAVELYYALHPDHWGAGLISEAATAFLRDVFDRFPINTVRADRFVDNPASGRVLEKLGFEETGSEMGTSAGRLEPAPVITYALTREGFDLSGQREADA